MSKCTICTKRCILCVLIFLVYMHEHKRAEINLTIVIFPYFTMFYDNIIFWARIRCSGSFSSSQRKRPSFNAVISLRLWSWHSIQTHLWPWSQNHFFFKFWVFFRSFYITLNTSTSFVYSCLCCHHVTNNGGAIISAYYQYHLIKALKWNIGTGVKMNISADMIGQ